MPILININVTLAKRKMNDTKLTDQVDISLLNPSILKNGQAKAIRLSTLKKICGTLACQPGNLLAYQRPEEQSKSI